MKSVGVFVYGDIGRSPRMQNHAIQLSSTYNVYFLGYFQTAPKSAVLQNQNIKIIDLQIRNLQYFRKVSFYLYALIRLILQTLQIIYYLGIKYRNLQYIFVQNPPSIPNLFAIWLTSFIARYKIIIDFHNYGYTILNLNIKNRFIMKIAIFYQKYFAKKADGFLCVSNAMKKDLEENWNIQAITLYDRPLPLSKGKIDKNEFLNKYNQRKLQQNQLLLVSSTSWTKDQDFSILLDALQNYNQSEGKMFIRTFITGKGPQKQRYLSIMNQRRQNWKKISIDAIWLQADDYPRLLSICDLGVCLHYSSSGYDLPMKVVDMFGAGIPVLAINYLALPQLVKNGKNGYIFANKQELANKLFQISNNPKLINFLKIGVQKQSKYTWSSQWNKKVYPIIKQ